MDRKEAQRLLDDWCADWEVPKIKVEFRTYLEGQALGFFDDVQYVIYLKADQGEDVLRHEFRHYIILLIRRAHDLEERICDE